MNKMLVVVLGLAMCASAFDLSSLDFSAMIQTGTSTNDAVQAVYDLLNDLKTTNLEAQRDADEKNNSDEEIGLNRIGALTKVQIMNQKAWQNAKGHREVIGQEYRNANDFINWATQRIAEIERRSIELQELRCFDNGLFIRAIRQHNDALAVIKLLKTDLSGYLTGQPSSLAEVKVENVADKLKNYSNLFNQNAMNKFAQLASEQASGNAELHAQGQEEQFNGSAGGKTGGNNAGQQIYNLLIDLEEQLRQSLAALEQNEIASYYQLADWLSDSDAEKENLADEIQRKSQLQDKLVVQEQAALAVQAKALNVLKDSQNAINAATADLEEKRSFWLEEFNRRNEENALIDEVIHIFKQQVMDMAGNTSWAKK